VLKERGEEWGRNKTTTSFAMQILVVVF